MPGYEKVFAVLIDFLWPLGFPYSGIFGSRHAPGDGNINLQEFSKLVEPLGQIWLGMCLTKWLPLRSTGSAEVSETEILDGSTGAGIF